MLEMSDVHIKKRVSRTPSLTIINIKTKWICVSNLSPKTLNTDRECRCMACQHGADYIT